MLADYAWYAGNRSEQKTRAVGQKKPNRWGLFDMHGNVREWCADWWGPYPARDVTDPTGPRTGRCRVCRGGSWGYVASLCRCAKREDQPPEYRGGYIGLRVVLEPGGAAVGTSAARREDFGDTDAPQLCCWRRNRRPRAAGG